MLRWIEKKIGRFAIPNLPLILAGGMLVVFVLGAARPRFYTQLLMEPDLVLQGQVWRLFTFLFVAPVLDPHSLLRGVNILFFLINLYLLWFFGSALENEWGPARFNVYVLTGWAAAVAASFLVPALPATNVFIYGSIFLAFAFLNPDFTLLLFFILPVKVKWLALIAWLGYGYMLLTGNWMIRILVLAGVVNFLLFFWPDLLRLVGRKMRGVRHQAVAARERDQPFHKCVICGKTDRSHPTMDFRYCPQCTNAPCYCSEHIHNHQHR